MVASVPIHAFLETFQAVLCTVFFPSHWLLSYITVVKTMDRGEREMNPVAMERILAKAGIEKATCSQVSNATV